MQSEEEITEAVEYLLNNDVDPMPFMEYCYERIMNFRFEYKDEQEQKENNGDTMTIYKCPKYKDKWDVEAPSHFVACGPTDEQLEFHKKIPPPKKPYKFNRIKYDTPPS